PHPALGGVGPRDGEPRQAVVEPPSPVHALRQLDYRQATSSCSVAHCDGLVLGVAVVLQRLLVLGEAGLGLLGRNLDGCNVHQWCSSRSALSMNSGMPGPDWRVSCGSTNATARVSL